MPVDFIQMLRILLFFISDYAWDRECYKRFSVWEDRMLRCGVLLRVIVRVYERGFKECTTVGGFLVHNQRSERNNIFIISIH